jgi:hypothetical protein
MTAPALACAAGCGTALHPAAAAGGHDRHPACEPGFTPGAPVTAWGCLTKGCTSPGGPAVDAADALARIDAHEQLAHGRLRYRGAVRRG